MIGTAFSLWVWARQKDIRGLQLWEACAKPLELAGIIILITAAGGAFGAMLGHTGIGTAIKELTGQISINYVACSFVADRCGYETGTGFQHGSHDHHCRHYVCVDPKWRRDGISPGISYDGDWIWKHVCTVDERQWFLGCCPYVWHDHE